tara:strand:+ start:316 stop:483 length:168 start_codon:yes stop_codon:yes gene_type:complete
LDYHQDFLDRLATLNNIAAIKNNTNPDTRKVAPINVKGIEKYPVSLYIIYVLVAK